MGRKIRMFAAVFVSFFASAVYATDFFVANNSEFKDKLGWALKGDRIFVTKSGVYRDETGMSTGEYRYLVEKDLEIINLADRATTYLYVRGINVSLVVRNFTSGDISFLLDGAAVEAYPAVYDCLLNCRADYGGGVSVRFNNNAKGAVTLEGNEFRESSSDIAGAAWAFFIDNGANGAIIQRNNKLHETYAYGHAIVGYASIKNGSSLKLVDENEVKYAGTSASNYNDDYLIENLGGTFEGTIIHGMYDAMGAYGNVWHVVAGPQAVSTKLDVIDTVMQPRNGYPAIKIEGNVTLTVTSSRLPGIDGSFADGGGNIYDSELEVVQPFAGKYGPQPDYHTLPTSKSIGKGSWSIGTDADDKQWLKPSTIGPYEGGTESVTCTGFTYTDWNACQIGGFQTRDVLTSLPSGCSGGTPVTEQACTYVPPTCVYSYSEWSACGSNGLETRTVLSSSPDGCVGTPVTTQACTYVPPAPTATFAANPASIQSGQSSTLSWTTSGATSVTLNSAAVAASGSQSVSPNATATYTLAATNAGGTTTRTVTVTVTVPQSTWYKDADGDGYSDGTTLVAINRPAGYKLASELIATSGDCNDADASINPGAVDLAGDGIDQDCSGADTPLPAKPVVTFTASSTSIKKGESVTLTWSSDCGSVTLDDQAVLLSGSKSVSPASTTTYRLAATNAGGTTSAAVTVTVTDTSTPPATGDSGGGGGGGGGGCFIKESGRHNSIAFGLIIFGLVCLGISNILGAKKP